MIFLLNKHVLCIISLFTLTEQNIYVFIKHFKNLGILKKSIHAA